VDGLRRRVLDPRQTAMPPWPSSCLRRRHAAKLRRVFKPTGPVRPAPRRRGPLYAAYAAQRGG